MSIKNRLRLWLGVIVVIVILCALFINLDNSLANVGSQSAELMAQTYTVGTDYSGIVTQQYVQVGQTVHAGQQLFEIQSNLLAADLANGSLNKSQLAYTVNGDNEIVLKATVDGVVSSIDYLQGAFVPANREVATITKSNSTYVQAKYLLAPPDYARLKAGNIITVTLPNDQRLNAKVFNFSVESSGNQVYTVVQATVQGLRNNDAFTAGTPVSTQLHLSGKTFYASLLDEFNKLFKPKG